MNKVMTQPGPRASLAVQGPFDEFSIDAIGPLPETENGFKYILVAVDNFSKFLFGAPAVNTDADSAAKFILSLGAIFPYPKAFTPRV